MNDGLLRKEQDHVDQQRTDHVKPKVNECRALCFLFTGKGSEQRRRTGTYITAKNDIQRNGQGQQVLICKEQHDADRHGRALNDGGQNQSHQRCEKMMSLYGGQQIHHGRLALHRRHRARHRAKSKEQHAKPDHDLGKLLDLVVLDKHHAKNARKQNHGSIG